MSLELVISRVQYFPRASPSLLYSTPEHYRGQTAKPTAFVRFHHHRWLWSVRALFAMFVLSAGVWLSTKQILRTRTDQLLELSVALSWAAAARATSTNNALLPPLSSELGEPPIRARPPAFSLCGSAKCGRPNCSLPRPTQAAAVSTQTREFWIIYRGPGFLAVVWFGSSPPPPPLSRP